MKPLETRYRITRTPRGVRAFHIDPNGERLTLPHLTKHSPTGFEYGYAGSGPADLARSILGHFFEVSNPSEVAYQQLKNRVIANLDRDAEHELTGYQILDVLTGNQIVYLTKAHRLERKLALAKEENTP